MATTQDRGPQSPTFPREEIEHAHTSVIRLRERLRTLAAISSASTAAERGLSMTRESVSVLNVVGCVVQSPPGEDEEGRFFLHGRDGIAPLKIRILAENLKSRVASSGSSIIIQNLRQQFPGQHWLETHNVDSYLGVPIFGADGSLSAIAGVFGGRNRIFGDEDDWWLRTAGQLVSDLLIYEAAQSKQNELQQLLVPGSSTSLSESGGRKSTILVIDDDRMLNDVICELLTMEGYDVEAAFNGVDAIQAFQPAKHDLAITDVAMPLMNGWELIAALRVRSPALPIILISGYQTGEWNQSYLTKQGVSAVLTKPLDLNELTALVGKFVRTVSESASV